LLPNETVEKSLHLKKELLKTQDFSHENLCILGFFDSLNNQLHRTINGGAPFTVASR
jgi:hypothetical protein